MTKTFPAQGRPVSACQRCRGLKVACDRARPRCIRCARAGAACEYGPAGGQSPELEAGSGQPSSHGHLVPQQRISGPSPASSGPPSSTQNSPAWPSPSDIVSDMLMQTLALPRDSASRESIPTRETTPPEHTKRCIKLKRDRAILSCDRCRRHKVRCDRKVPCGRCIKNRRETQCVYTESTHTPSRALALEDGGALNLIATRFVDANWDSQFRNGTHWNKLLIGVSFAGSSCPGEC